MNMNPNHWMGSLLKLSFAKNKFKKKIALSKNEIRYIQQNIVVGDQNFIKGTTSLDYKSIHTKIKPFNKNYIKDIIK